MLTSSYLLSESGSPCRWSRVKEDYVISVDSPETLFYHAEGGAGIVSSDICVKMIEVSASE